MYIYILLSLLLLLLLIILIIHIYIYIYIYVYTHTQYYDILHYFILHTITLYYIILYYIILSYTMRIREVTLVHRGGETYFLCAPGRGGASREQISHLGITGMWYSRVPQDHHDLHPPSWVDIYMRILCARPRSRAAKRSRTYASVRAAGALTRSSTDPRGYPHASAHQGAHTGVLPHTHTYLRAPRNVRKGG